MDVSSTSAAEKFGSVLGYAPGNVPAFSSDYDSADDRELPDRHAYRSYIDGIYMGYKWQCVEFARRWMYVNKGYIFDDVAMAYDIFDLTSVRVVRDNSHLPLKAFRNGSLRHPQPGALMVWDEGGEFERTGHVAVVVEVSAEWVRVAEQNVGHKRWTAGAAFAREIKAKVAPTGEFWVECSFGDATILGWVMQTEDGTDAEPVAVLDTQLLNLELRELPDRGQGQRSWLNLANADEAAYVRMMGGQRLSAEPGDALKYFCLSETAGEALESATAELHALFMHATDYVLRDDRLLGRFNLPRALWPKIHQSWNNRRNEMITGRFDFSLSERGLKLYEYNCDSASCHMETGKVQGRWAAHFGCHNGRDAGAGLHEELVKAWRKQPVGEVLHIMRDDHLEETYHALFMQEAIERAGITSTILNGVNGLSWTADGDIVDHLGVPIRWVWKTWAWETALDQIRLECEDDALQAGASWSSGQPPAAAPRLADVLLSPQVMVFEPLWTLIPSNKAILPVLWQLFPNHPYLLETAFELTTSLQETGYVVKPIVGRCGSNITIVDGSETIREETAGNFGHRDRIYQQFCPLPELDGRYVQICSFSVDGSYAASCVRLDRAMVINDASDVLALRVLPDSDYAMSGGI